jgi:hypothetical protein
MPVRDFFGVLDGNGRLTEAEFHKKKLKLKQEDRMDSSIRNNMILSRTSLFEYDVISRFHRVLHFYIV